MQSEVFKFFFGTIILSLTHGSIPNHWVPFVIIGKREKWKFNKVFLLTLIGGIFHNFSTILIGYFINNLGNYTFSRIQSLEKILPTFLFIFLGMIYLVFENKEKNELDEIKEKSAKGIIFLIYVSMFFSPCLEIQGIYFSASNQSISVFLLISILYASISIASMVFFSYIGYKGLMNYYPKFLEKFERKFIGLFLIVLGILNFYF